MSQVETEAEAVGPNPLAELIERRIAKSGPMPFEEYMDIWNNGATDELGRKFPGFYNSESTVIGSHDQVDFSTAPETTPVYGTLMARQIAEMWTVMGKEPEFRIVELGGGNGTLAYDIIHAIKLFHPEMPIRYTIVEQSPVLAEKQRGRLGDFGVEIVQGSALDSIPKDVKGVVLSNELVDDLPTRIVRKTADVWEELRVQNDTNAFVEEWGAVSPEALDYAEKYLGHIQKEGQIVPASVSSRKLLESINSSLKKGFVITADYFRIPDKAPYYTVSARNRRLTKNADTNRIDHLFKANVGKANITTEVDFQSLSRVGEEIGFQTVADVTLGGFLQSLGYYELVQEAGKESKHLFGGGRDFSYFRTERKLRTSGERILIQAKGINLVEPLRGSLRRFIDSPLKPDDQYYRENFTPIK